MGEIKRLVKQVIEKYQSNDPFLIAAERGIIIQRQKLKGMLGYFHTYRRVSVICIDENLSDTETRFVCAHELGHAFMHPQVNTPFLRHNTLFPVGKIEREANKFAVELLIPDEEIGGEVEGCISYHELSKQFGVPEELINLKNQNFKRETLHV